MSIYDIPVKTVHGGEANLRDHEGKVLLVVNTASFCGLTPHYQGLQRLHERLSPLGFSVLGFPCNQFGEQEPGTATEIVEFCQLNFGVTFPLYEKLEVNGENRHPLFQKLVDLPNEKGRVGDVQWNFEKWVIGADGEPVARFGPKTEPENEDLVRVIESQLEAARAGAAG